MTTRLLVATTALVALTALAGCATSLQPKLSDKPALGYDLVDPAKVHTDKYKKDYAECVVLANQDAVDVERAAAGALSTVADKASLGILGGRPSKDADRSTVLKRCLTGRGYNVLR